MKNQYRINSILYIDADLFFFEDIKRLYDDWGGQSVYVTALRLSSKWERLKGKYSAGLIGFKRDQEGMKCLKWWRRKCLSWCYDKHEKNRWGDQKYLDRFSSMCSNLKVSEDQGINTGPWNVRKGRKIYNKNNVIFFNEYRLTCYHFSGFRIYNQKEYELCNRKKLPEKSKLIYDRYVAEITKIITKIMEIDENVINNISFSLDKQKLFNYLNLQQ